MIGHQALPVAWGAGHEVGPLDAQVLEELKDPFLNGKLYCYSYRATSRV